MSGVRVYGLASCDGCRRARQWLAARGSEAEFVDLARTGLEPATLDRWLDALSWEALLNRRSISPRLSPIREARARRWRAGQGAGESGRAGVLDSTLSTRTERNAGLPARSAPAAVNRRETRANWRALPAERREGIDGDRARALMLEEPRLVKRPVLETQDTVQVGFDPDAWERVL